MTLPVTPAGPVVGIVSPGEMGSALGRVLRDAGARVLTTTAGRSARTARLADAAGLEIVADLDAVLGEADVLLSVVPPQEALSTARALVTRARRLGVRPTFVDMNAIAPGEVAVIGTLAGEAGLPFADGAISGAPPRPDALTTRLVFAGPTAVEVAALAWGGAPWGGLPVTLLGGRTGAASAAKMCTGGVRKGLGALIINALRTAAEFDVLEPVLAELTGALGRDPLAEAELAATKAWRFAPEMDSVAATQQEAGLDPALYRAIAEVFLRTSTSALGGRRPEDVDRTSSRPAAAVVADLAPG